jgi:hypothetical protein
MHVATTLSPQPPAIGAPMPADPDPLQAAGTHAVVCGPHALETLCTLLHAGAASVTLLRDGERPEPACADLLIAPRVASVEQAARIACHAARALRAGGAARIGIVPEAHGAILHTLRGCLRRQGFRIDALRTNADGHQLVATLTGLPA